jgi:hypothetical protein
MKSSFHQCEVRSGPELARLEEHELFKASPAIEVDNVQIQALQDLGWQLSNIDASILSIVMASALIPWLLYVVLRVQKDR